jgi:hypothetical protein
LAPWKFVPSVGSVEIVSVTPGNTEVLVGANLEIAAEIKNPMGKPHRATLFVTAEGQPPSQLPMAGDEKRCRFKVTVPSVLKPLKYRLEIGDSQTPLFAVGVREKPVVEQVDITFHYPAYLRQQDERLSQKSLDIEAPQFTVAELRLHPSTAVAKGHIELDADRYPGRVEEGGKLLVCTLPLLKDGSYTVRLFNDAGHTDPNPRLNRITVLTDKPPTVELLKPARQSSAAPGSDLSVMIRAADDHGLDRLRLEMKLKSAETEAGSAEDAKSAADSAPAKLVKEWTDFAGDSITSAVRQHRLELRADAFQPGQTVLVRAVAFDRREINQWGLDLKPQEGVSPWHSIKIVPADAQSSAALEQLDGLRSAIWKILEKQIHARTATAVVLKQALPSPAGRGAGGEGGIREAGQQAGISQSRSPHPNPLPAGEGTDVPNPLPKGEGTDVLSPLPKVEGTDVAIGQVRTEQIDIQKSSVDLVKSIGPAERDQRLSIKRILNALAFGEMLQAVSRCDDWMKLKSPDDWQQPVGQLTAAQDRIIDVLRKLLDAARHAEADVLAEMQRRPGSDLPDDVKQKLEEMRAKLDKFLAQQKKLIEAGENLAKKPVDDFTKEEEELLKGMAAAEDDWAKFIEDLRSDLSKLPEQDFANSTTAKELVEIQTELKMAEDALLKKSADIAVPLEQLGYERAEELKANLEKWLPDTPDREKWSQEESLTDKDKEAPMAELPGELEDLVGQLMEGEEDLFDEMEDVSSSAADSLDKGAGWDAMDGPISNMSGKGVTGNRLPNSSEIGGRAGEGRQGRASGEFIGDEAVGKGGRKTPSRLTPDAYVKGQIKDHSQQSAGGATGGGKESGKGGEGLEGPQRRGPGPRDAERLAGRQAALRNKAEGIDLQFQVSNFHRTDLEKMIEIMSQVERDVKAGRYQNALRQRHVLAEGLGNVKQYLDGELEVRQDATPNLPADIQKKILGSMHDPSPEGWEELNRQYFERLASGGEAAPAAEKSAAK